MSTSPIRGMYCYRCGSRKVVRGNLGESARFYPLRGWLQAALGKPVFLQNQYSHACLDCGLTCNEVDAYELRKNLRDYGLVAHSTAVMKAVQQDTPLGSSEGGIQPDIRL